MSDILKSSIHGADGTLTAALSFTFDVEIDENVRRLRRFRNFLVPRLIADGSVTVLCDRNRPQSEGFQKPLRPRL